MLDVLPRAPEEIREAVTRMSLQGTIQRHISETLDIRHAIVNRILQEAALLAKRYVSVARSITTYQTHLDFTKTCREINVVPRSLQLKRLVHTAEGHKIIAKAEQRLLNARIHECHSVIKKKELDLFFLRRQLQHRLPDVFPSLEEFARNVVATTARKQQAAHKSKLTTLQGEKPHRRHDNDNFVVNLSSRQLSPTEHSVLAKGHNFNVNTAHPSLPRIIAATEEGIRRLDNGIRENVRLKAIGVLSKIGKRREHNMSREENNAIRSLRNDENIVILPVDKGDAMVVLDREAYSDKNMEKDSHTLRSVTWRKVSNVAMCSTSPSGVNSDDLYFLWDQHLKN
ncbi:uncharacterized protein LOC119379226 [Rhipicephalus sanguineus]|uniref:uncharacterized protein LOC119379226 n=1 Tax=Rhipicephalus sanguineus TaxID=34632 RepID=UPI00189455A5|nr:uncharacterized protein LOC119379226 [Rhipicephalus sanguineus]